MGFQLRQLPASNFTIEVLRSDARVPKDPKHFKESIRKKIRGGILWLLQPRMAPVDEKIPSNQKPQKHENANYLRL